MGPGVTVSIVSHGQGQLVAALLADLASCTLVAEVLVTRNLPEGSISCPPSLEPRLRFIDNVTPKGFAANHNQAFKHCRTQYFAVVNPDIRFAGDPFPTLNGLLADAGTGVVAPVVYNPQGGIEDSARRFPTLAGLLAKLLGVGDGRVTPAGSEAMTVDWVAGMFMLYREDVFRETGGFDERFFLYYEDVDICVRLWRAGYKIVLHPGVSVVHAAQRASRRRFRHMTWHLASMTRYLVRHSWRLPHTRSGS